MIRATVDRPVSGFGNSRNMPPGVRIRAIPGMSRGYGFTAIDLARLVACGVPSATMEYVNCVASTLGISVEDALAQVERYLGEAVARATGLTPEQVALIASCGTPSTDSSFVSCAASALGLDESSALALIQQYLTGTTAPPTAPPSPGRCTCYGVDANGRLRMMVDPAGNLMSPPPMGHDCPCPSGTSATPLPFVPTPRRTYLPAMSAQEKAAAIRGRFVPRWTAPQTKTAAPGSTETIQIGNAQVQASVVSAAPLVLHTASVIAAGAGFTAVIRGKTYKCNCQRQPDGSTRCRCE